MPIPRQLTAAQGSNWADVVVCHGQKTTSSGAEAVHQPGEPTSVVVVVKTTSDDHVSLDVVDQPVLLGYPA
jgi:hypothetical protein